MFKTLCLVWGFSLVVSVNIIAETVYSLEDILAKQHRFKFESSLAYYTKQSQFNDQKMLINHDPASGVSQQLIGLIQTNQEDILQTFLSLKYGFSHVTQLGLSLVFEHYALQKSSQIAINHKQHGYIKKLKLSLRQRIKAEDFFPAIYISVQSDAFDRQVMLDRVSRPHYFKQFQFNATLYKSLDPIVLALVFGVQMQENYKIEAQLFKSKPSFFMRPAVYFTINDTISLNWGLSFKKQGQLKHQYSLLNADSQWVSFHFGAGYLLDHKTSFSLETELAGNSRQHNSIMLSFLYKI